MNDPSRWLDRDSDATELERDLVRAGRAHAMPAGERARLWGAIAAGCTAGAAAATATAATAAAAAATQAGGGGSALAGLISWKGLVVLAVVSGGGLATYQLARPAAVPPTPVIHASPPVSAPAPLRAAPAGQPSAEIPAPVDVAPPRPVALRHAPEVHRPVAAVVDKPAAPAGPAVGSPAAEEAHRAESSRLAEESRAVIAARRALRDGDIASCLRILDAAHATFPGGALAQEREALTIQALARSGQSATAAERAARFLRDHPESPYAADLRKLPR